MNKLQFIQDQLLMHGTKIAACTDWAKGEDNSAQLKDERWLMGIYKAEQERLEQAFAYVNRPATFQKMEDFD